MKRSQGKMFTNFLYIVLNIFIYREKIGVKEYKIGVIDI